MVYYMRFRKLLALLASHLGKRFITTRWSIGNCSVSWLKKIGTRYDLCDKMLGNARYMLNNMVVWVHEKERLPLLHSQFAQFVKIQAP